MQVRRKIARHWSAKARTSTSPLTILSPFITGTLCKSLVAGKVNAKIYTRFDVPLFASGGSCLNQLEALLRDGHELFKIDDLHAKVVMDEDSFVTIGSQNLTKRGRLHNKELTASFSSADARALIRERIAPWLDEAEPITTEMIEMMRASVQEAAALHKAFREACEKAETRYQARASGRCSADNQLLDEETEPAAVQVERARRLQEIRDQIGASLVPLKRSAPSQRCRVLKPRLETHSPYLSAGKGSLTNWQIDGKPVELDQGKRYLCVLETGDLGWGRVASGRITKISRGISTDEGLLPIDHSLALELSGEMADLRRLPPGANLAGKVWRGDTRICTVPLMFNLTDCQVLDPVHPNNRALRLAPGERSAAEVVDWFTSHKAEARELILSEILGPFEYQQRLLGENADSFFGPPKTYCFASVAQVEDKPVLLVNFPYKHNRKRRRHSPAGAI